VQNNTKTLPLSLEPLNHIELGNSCIICRLYYFDIHKELTLPAYLLGSLNSKIIDSYYNIDWQI